ncbi:golgi apyrase [Verticillium alfalfae VaMs.102]|uniref:Golgi apyrase n=1 Tax=Verticillium alfalfae (strain VaMs.102 / ATCC MYA-4576 / FGSC 10136) TaxID=526221 RepID=C9SUL7_VERA1|nr:golgi apyrase [Verticillium alfalfae VaMs.102]EEY22127.1 golgi apyrase [Verticillium alfalfae VaMs.102]
MGKKSKYGIIFDAGSSGTRLYVYKWKEHAEAVQDATKEELHRLPKIKLETSEKIHPGVSSFADKPEDIGPEHLKALVELALDEVPASKVAETPIYLMATAGMRLLPEIKQQELLQSMCIYLRDNTDFSLPDCNTNIQVISGETEGLYGWLATNYLLGGFDEPQNHQHGEGHHTYGFLDMGGASAQIAFAPNSTEAKKHSNDLKLVRLRTMDGTVSEHKVFTATWLGYGANQARERYVDRLQESYDKSSNLEVPDPCMPKGLRTTPDGDPLTDKQAKKELTLVGTGLFKECLANTEPLLGKDAPCLDDPCLLNGQHVPSIDFSINHFVGVSEYWHTTHGVFGGKHKAYDLATYQQNVVEFCSRDWIDIASDLEARKKTLEEKARNAQEACFKASWLINVLYEGIGIPRPGLEHEPLPGLNVSDEVIDGAKHRGFLDPFRPVNKIDGIEVSWTLGKMILYAAGQVPPLDDTEDLPVGFGSNVPEAKDFEPAGSQYAPIREGNGRQNNNGGLIGKATSTTGSTLLLVVVLVAFFTFLLRKRDRRSRWCGWVGAVFRRNSRPGSPRKPARGLSFANKIFGRGPAQYERVLEEGDADQFELADVESDDYSASDSSEASRSGRVTGLPRPKLNLERYEDGQGALSVDRGGVAVRTESRERLVPSAVNAGRRSRTGSPTRLKSPLTNPR